MSEEKSAYDSLTGKQKRFVDAYIGEANCNATMAARLAGYKDPEQAGYENKRKQEISTAIDERMKSLSIGPEEILHRLTEHARSNIQDVTDEAGRLPASLSGLTRQQAALIKRHAVKASKYGDAVTIEIHDAQAALLALAKRYDLFPDHTRHSGNLTLDVILNALPADFREEVRGELDALVRAGAGSPNGRH